MLEAQGELREWLAQRTIRARFAYALACVERVAVCRGQVSGALKEVLGLLWTYCELRYATEWLAEVEERLGALMAHAAFLVNGRCPGDQLRVDDPLRVVPDDMLIALDDCIEVARVHMFGGIVGFGERSVAVAESVVRWAEMAGVVLPPLLPFEEYRFEDGAWGWEFSSAPFRLAECV